MTARIVFDSKTQAQTFCAEVYEKCGLVCSRTAKCVTFSVGNLTQCDAVLATISAHKTEIFSREFNNR